jgi:hypothetical protein
MKRTIPATVFALTFGYGSAPTYAYDLMDAAAMMRNVNTANPGLETIMPLLINTGTWSGDVPNSRTVSFRVFPSGRTNLLYGSAARSVAPPRPCTTPTRTGYEIKQKLVALPGSAWTHLVEGHNVWCNEASGGAYKENELVFVYSANLSAAGGAVWTKTFTARWLDAFQGIDTNGDGILDALMLVMPYANATGGYNAMPLS